MSTGLPEIPTADLWSNTYGTPHYFARPDRITFVELAEHIQPCPTHAAGVHIYTGADTRFFGLIQYVYDRLNSIELCTDEVNHDRDNIWDGPASTSTIAPENDGGGHDNSFCSYLKFYKNAGAPFSPTNAPIQAKEGAQMQQHDRHTHASYSYIAQAGPTGTSPVVTCSIPYVQEPTRCFVRIPMLPLALHHAL